MKGLLFEEEGDDELGEHGTHKTVKVILALARQDHILFFFFTLVTGPRRSLSLELSDTKVYEP